MTFSLPRRRVLGPAIAAMLGGCGGGHGATPDGGLDASPAVDGAPDAAQAVDCTGDHAETMEASNDAFGNGAPEESGLQLAAGGPTVTLCGQIDPAQADNTFADADFYAIAIAGTDPVSVRFDLGAPDGASASQLELDLFASDGSFVGGGLFRNGYAMVAGVTLAPGTYFVGVSAANPAPAAPVLYTVSLAEDTLVCPASVAAPDLVEGHDGLGNRDNDMVAVTYADSPPAVLTTIDTDVPEPLGSPLAPDTVYHYQGQAAALASPGDDYLDRDTYLIHTGPTTNEVELRLSWPDADVDLDVVVFAENQPADVLSLSGGLDVGTTDDEVVTMNLDPDTSYWLWVGTFDDLGTGGDTALPLTYDLTMCARTHVAP